MTDLSIGAKLSITLLFVLLNGFFVAAEFALVKVRPGRIAALAAQGSRPARMVQYILKRLDLYLSGCQLGITIASLVLGSLAEPAVAALLVAAADAMGWSVEGPYVHVFALAIALTIITILHMTVGEQAPKIWALQRAEPVALMTAYPLRVFVFALQPLIWGINHISNGMLRAAGIRGSAGHDAIYNVGEIRDIIRASASAGQLSSRQELITENVLGLINLEVRHIMLPRIDVVWLSTQKDRDANLRVIRESGHSRYPLCADGLDSVVGIVHTRDVLGCLLAGKEPDLRVLAKKPMIVPDTQPLSRFILEAQGNHRHCAVVVDEHGTATGLAFLEDALEEIVGPIRDEFDRGSEELTELEDGVVECDGAVPLPEVERILGVALDEDTDTVGGFVVAQLGRLPSPGDVLQVGEYRVTVTAVSRRRITRLRFEPGPPESARTEGE